MKNKGTRWLSSFLIGVVAFTGVFAITTSVYTDPVRRSAVQTVPGPAPQPEQALANIDSPAPVYRHSVISGGVRKSSELKSALAHDRFASVHYADFDVANAYMVHVKAPRSVHVSYRIGDEIYWTKKKVQLSSGETLLTDGKSFVRARCGNRLADTAQPKVSEKEPPPEDLDTVIAPPRGALDGAGKTPNAVGRLMPPFNGFPDGTQNVSVPTEPPTSVVLPPPLPTVPTPPIIVVPVEPEVPPTDIPEPASLALAMLALISLVTIRQQRRKRSQPGAGR